MKTGTKRVFYLLLIAVIATAAAVMTVITSQFSPFETEVAASRIPNWDEVDNGSWQPNIKVAAGSKHMMVGYGLSDNPATDGILGKKRPYGRVQYLSVAATGYNEYGNLGTGNVKSTNRLTAVQLYEFRTREFNDFRMKCTDKNSFIVFEDYYEAYYNENDWNSREYVYAAGDNSEGQIGGSLLYIDDFFGWRYNGLDNHGKCAIGKDFVVSWDTDNHKLGYFDGNNLYGQLGDEGYGAGYFFQNKNVTYVACGDYFTYVIADGKLYATGDNRFGQLATGDTSFKNRNTFKEVNLPSVPTGAVLDSVWCGPNNVFISFKQNDYYYVFAAGQNNFGQLGIGYSDTRFPGFGSVGEFKNLKTIECGKYHTAIVCEIYDGQPALFTAGRNNYGQLGYGVSDTDKHIDFDLVQFFDEKGTEIFPEISSVACGDEFTAIVADNKVYTVGSNTYGQLGLGDYEDRIKFTEVPLNYMVNFDANGGYSKTDPSATVVEQVLPYGESATLAPNTFVMDGCSFENWQHFFTNSLSAVNSSFSDNEEVRLKLGLGATSYLRAKWKVNDPETRLSASATTMTYGDGKIELKASVKKYENFTYEYQWYKDGAILHGETNETLTLENVKDSGKYKVLVKATVAVDCGPIENDFDGSSSDTAWSDSASAFTNELTITINKAALSPDFEISDRVFNGTAAENPVVSGNLCDGAVTYKYAGTTNGGAEYLSMAAPKEAGDYTLSISIAETDNTFAYETPAGQERKFSITRAERAPTTEFAESFIYNGEAITAPVVGNVDEEPAIAFYYTGTTNSVLQYASENPPTEAGTYSVKVTIGQTANYQAAEYTRDFIIERASIEVTVTMAGYAYGETPTSPVLSGNYGGEDNVLFSYKGEDDGGYDSPQPPTKPGKYAVLAYIGERDNYAAYTAMNGFRVNKAAMADLSVSLAGWKYGQATEVVPVMTGNLAGREPFYYYAKKNASDQFQEYNGDILKAGAGEYMLRAFVDGGDNYQTDEVRTLFTIEKGDQTPTVNIKNFAYKEKFTPSVTDVKESGSVTLAYGGTDNSGQSVADSSQLPTLAGSYTLTVSIAETENYAAFTQEYGFTIERKTVYAPYIADKLKTGETVTADVRLSEFQTALCTVEENNGGLTAGEYPVKLKLKDPQNYAWNGGEISGTNDEILTLYFHISEKENSWTQEPDVVDKTNLAYGGTLATTGGAQYGVMTVSYKTQDGAPFDGIPKDAGVYIAVFDVAATDEAMGLHKEVQFRINPWELFITIDNKETVYGQTAELTYTITSGEVMEGDDLQITLTKAAGDNVGTYAITGVSGNANYNVTFTEGTYTVTQATYDMSGVTFADKTVTYSNWPHTLAITGDLPAGVSVTYLNNDVRTDAGTYTVTAKFSGDETNYKAIPDMTATLTIEKAEYDMSGVEFHDTVVTFDGQAHTLEIKGTLPTADGAQVTVIYEWSNESHSVTNVSDGPMTVTAIFATTSGNYKAPASMTATLTIAPKQLTAEMFTVAEGEYVYNGTQHTPEIAGAEAETTLTENDYGDLVYGANVDAGTGTIIVTGKGNYGGEAELTFTIAKATFEPTLTLQNWKYGQTENAPQLGGNTSGGEYSYNYTGTSNGGATYSSPNAPSRAGSYTVTVTIAETDNYASVTQTCDFEITRTTISPVVEMADWTYGERANTPLLTGNVADGSVSCKYVGTSNSGVFYEKTYGYLETPDDITRAGRYTLSVTIAQTENYLAGRASVTFTVHKKAIAPPQIQSKAFDQGYTLTADVPASEYYNVTRNDGGSLQGTYDVILTLKDPDNHAWQTDAIVSGDKQENVTLIFRVIGVANSWNVVPQIKEKTEYGNEIEFMYWAFNGQETATFVYKTAAGEILSEAPTALGNYVVVITIAETADYTGLTAELAFSIVPKQVTVTIHDKTSVYGEAFAAPTFTVSELAYGETKDVLNLRFTKEAGANAGTYAISGTWDNGNYAVTFVGGTYTITKATYDMSGVKFENKTVTYDSEKHSLTLTGELPAGVSVEYVGNGKTAAGSYEVIAKFSVADAENYHALTANELKATLTIEKATYDMSNVKFADETVTYDDEIHSLAVTGLPEGVSVTYEGNGKKNAGAYEVVAKFSVADAENYHALVSNELTATLTIKKATYDVSNMKFADETITYDGEIHSLTVTGLPAGVSVEYTGNGKKNAGTYEVTAKFTGDANYEALASVTATLTIDKAVYDMTNVKFADETITYDGETHSLVVTGLPAGVSVEYTGNDRKNAGEYEVTAKFKGDANYEPLADMTAVLTIGKATYDMSGVKFDGETIKYDGEIHSLAVTGLPAGVSVEYFGNGKKNAGVYEITAKFTVADTANHEALATSELKATLTINKATYDLNSIRFADETLFYDGDVHSLSVTGLPVGVIVEYVGNGRKVPGTYEVTAKFAGDANYEPLADMKATLTIRKAIYDMSGVKFESGSFEYDGETHSLTLTGNLPFGVNVEYVGNDKSEAGEYQVTVRFTGDANYEAIPDMTATLTIVEKGGCGGMVADGFTVAGISLAAFVCAAIALRKAKLAKRKNK